MLKVSLKLSGNETQAQRQKLERAAELMEKSINSVRFKNEVLEYSRTEWWSTGKLWWKKWHSRKVKGFAECSMSTEEVLSVIMSGAEDLSPEKDKEADIQVEVAVGSRGVIGWTNPHTPIQWISSWFINDSEVDSHEIAGNLAHEWMHKLGFDHAFNSYSGREHTVPYAVGYLVEKISRGDS